MCVYMYFGRAPETAAVLASGPFWAVLLHLTPVFVWKRLAALFAGVELHGPTIQVRDWFHKILKPRQRLGRCLGILA